MEKPLKFIVTFSESKISVDVVIRGIGNFMNEMCQDESSINFVSLSEPQNMGLDIAYKTDVFEIEINLMYSSEYPSSIICKIIQDWCSPERNELSYLWLSLANTSVLENSGKLCHSDVLVKETAFGTLPDMQHFMQHYHYESNSEEKEIISSFLHSQKKCTIYTCFSHKKNCDKKSVHNMFQFYYNSVCRVIVNYVPDSDIVQIFLHLQHIPFLFVESKRKEEEGSGETEVLASDQEYQERNWNRVLDFGCHCKNFFCSVERIGRCPIFKIVVPKKHRTHDIVERLIQRCPSSTIFHFANIETVHHSKSTAEIAKDLEKFPFAEELLTPCNKNDKLDIMFKCQFAWETILSRSLEVRDQILLQYKYHPTVEHWSLLRKKLNKCFKSNVEALINSLYDICEMVCKNLLFNFEDALVKLFKYHCKPKTVEPIPDGMCLVRRIILSPSRIICLPPSEHFDNRVIREYLKGCSENLLRVSVQDDDFGKLTFAIQRTYKKQEFLYRVVKKFLLDGIHIGPRKYQFLASSNSQLREHGIWMYAEDHNGNTAEKIRNWMGDFHAIKNVAKYMARMGQCFSTSDEAVQIELRDDNVDKIKDIQIMTDDGKYTFSDGVGMISQDLAQEVRKAFSENLTYGSEKYLYDPSAFQIRFKGCKGMVAVSKKLDGRKIAIRPSMEKFPCNSSSKLEIVKISAPRAVFLNRPLITILENLRVKDSVFLDLQKKMVFDLTDSLIYERKVRKMLENNTSLEFPFKKLSSVGISMTQEPFFRSLLLSVYKSMIEKLKCKARIAVPHKYGRNMMGIMDETGSLRENEIFAQYSEKVGNIKSRTKILTGLVLVTTNPCMHPGDVRKLMAVDAPELHHIKDCVVFPARGDRPIPDQMAGSDLDGDEYVIIWDPNLIFPEDNHDPMSYPPNEEKTFDRNIQVEDMVEFFCQYIQDDNIGPMANAYLAWADYNPDGIFSPVCQSIAKKYPQALDFAKSGTTCTLDRKERPHSYPDFMEKGSRNNSYKSTKSLGLLYRVIRNLEASVSNIDHQLSVVADLRLEVPGWKEFEELAKQRRQQYTDRVKNILRKYGLQSEAEVLTGYVSKLNEYNSNKYDSENAATLSKKYLIFTLKHYRDKFLIDCKNYGKQYSDKIIRQKMASAWYMVTYQNPEASALSFPWVVSDVLLEIQKKNSEEQKLYHSKSLFIDIFDEQFNHIFHNLVQERKNNNCCNCVSIMKAVMEKWMVTLSFILTTASDDVFCLHCLQRIIKTFRSQVICCSFTESNCTCTESCSPMKLILQCLKFYASYVPDIGKCGNKLKSGIFCEGFRDMNLHSLALKTYAAVAITQKIKYLGFVNAAESDLDFGSNEEGDPIRVPVTKDFEKILTGNVDKVCEILKNLSGVKRVHIDGSSERRGYYILVQSIGKAFQRWNLEELIMDDKCPSIIDNRMNL